MRPHNILRICQFGNGVAAVHRMGLAKGNIGYCDKLQLWSGEPALDYHDRKESEHYVSARRRTGGKAVRLAIENTLGIIHAEIEIEPGGIVEVVGPNASGKTSLAVCAQAVLARDANPLGLNAADAKRSRIRTTALTTQM